MNQKILSVSEVNRNFSFEIGKLSLDAIASREPVPFVGWSGLLEIPSSCNPN